MMHLSTVAEDLTSAVGDKLRFLGLFLDVWRKHNLAMTMIRDILMYMDRNFVRKEHKSSTIELGQILFRKIVISNSQLTDPLLGGTLELVDEFRRTSQFPVDLLPSLIDMLIESELFKEQFVPKFLIHTEQFFSGLVKAKLGDVGFVDWALGVTSQETKVECWRTIMHELEASLNVSIVESSCDVVIDKNVFTHTTFDQRRNIYKLYSRTPRSMSRLLQIFQSELVSAIRSCELSIEQLIEIRCKFSNMVSSEFENSSDFNWALKVCFEDNLNNAKSGSERKLALFMDSVCRKSASAASLIGESVAIFRFVFSKDIFEYFYRTYLSRRIFSGTLNLQIEHEAVSQLRSECGPEFTRKMETMLRDFENNSVNKDHDPFFKCTVCTTGVWPSMSAVAGVKLPPVLQSFREAFSGAYAKNFSGRRLTWILTEGFGEVRGEFSSGVYTLNVSTVQMLILNAFNEKVKISTSELEQRIGLPFTDLERHLLSLSKSNLLRMGEKDDDSLCCLNENFESKSRYMRVPQVTNKIIVENDAACDIEAIMEDDRKHLIEASLVRVMKTQRQLKKQHIVCEVQKIIGTRFVPSIAMIEARLCNLVEREFLAKDNDDLELYYYVA